MLLHRNTLILTIYLSLSPSSKGQGENNPYSVCVVGGGLSGLITTLWLQTKYSDVHLFEAKSTFGGSLTTVQNGSSVWEAGPLIFTVGADRLNAYLARYNLTWNAWEARDLSFFDPESGVVQDIATAMGPTAFSAYTRQVTEDLGRFRTIRAAYPAYIFGPGGYAQHQRWAASYPDLEWSTERWLSEKRLDSLFLLMGIAFTCEGYGDLRNLPALYMLRLLEPEVAVKLLALPFWGNATVAVGTIQQGFGHFAYRLADEVRNKHAGYSLFRLNRRLTPGPTRHQLWFRTTQGANGGPYYCSRTVLAFPPIIAKMATLVPDLSYIEKVIVSHVKIHKYVTSGVLLNPGKDYRRSYVGLYNPDLSTWPQGNGGAIAIARSGKWGGNPLAYTIYSWIYGKYTSSPSWDDQEATVLKLRELLFRWDKTVANQELAYTLSHEYFPHFTTDAIKDGAFEAFARDVQGRAGLWYATPLTSFGAMSPTIQNAEWVADAILKST